MKTFTNFAVLLPSTKVLPTNFCAGKIIYGNPQKFQFAKVFLPAKVSSYMVYTCTFARLRIEFPHVQGTDSSRVSMKPTPPPKHPPPVDNVRLYRTPLMKTYMYTYTVHVHIHCTCTTLVSGPQTTFRLARAGWGKHPYVSGGGGKGLRT